MYDPFSLLGMSLNHRRRKKRDYCFLLGCDQERRIAPFVNSNVRISVMMLLNNFVVVSLETPDELLRFIHPALLEVDEGLLADMAALRNKSEKEVREYGAAVLWNKGLSAVYLGNEIQGKKKDVYWPETLNSNASYLGTFHTHPYQQRYQADGVGIGFSNGDLAFYGMPHVKPNAHNLALHFVFSNELLYMIVYWKNSKDTTNLGKGEGDDITACYNYVKGVNRCTTDKKLHGQLIEKTGASRMGKEHIFYAMQTYIDQYDGEGHSDKALALENEVIKLNYPRYPELHMKQNIEMNKKAAQQYGYLFFMGECGGSPRHTNLWEE
jgi:hypothetical protein